MAAISADTQLKLISRAWGRQRGYVFFPWIDGSASDRAERIRGYHEGPAFLWPKERDKIIAHLEAHTSDDLYWCPSIFERKVRRMDTAMDEHALWADLDAINPEEIDQSYRPTMAWETSPGRYQGLWLISSGDLQGASWPGKENQRLTYYLDADRSGWDTTQLLRIPGWTNHKPEYRSDDGKPVQGKLLWHNDRRYLADDFEDLPEVESADAGIVDVLEETINNVDRLKVWGEVRLKVSKNVRELVAARSAEGGDRSEALWQIERDLADAGLTAAEIVAVVRDTVWNKFAGRADELRRLITEASKAVASRSKETVEALERDREEKPRPGNLFTMVQEAKPPVWLVKGILTEASCGFFAGEPKSFKSWSALDLALSIATGAPFLDAFDVLQPGPVLYIQEEDALPTLKDRIGKVMPMKTQDRVTLGAIGEDGVPTLVWEPANESSEFPKVAAIVREQFVISDTGWQAWLDEVLTEGYGGRTETIDEEGMVTISGIKGEPYKLVLLDPLMMIAGDVDENRAHEMTEKVYKPLKQLAEKHGVSITIVNHMRKGREGDTSGRGGQRMLGSMANHAWSENSLYFTHGRLGEMLVEVESKFTATSRFKIGNLRKRTSSGALTWQPEVELIDGTDDAEKPGRAPARRASTPRARNPRIGQGTRRKLATHLGLDPDAPQVEVRDAWEAAGHTWGDWEGIVNTRGTRNPDDPPAQRGRKPDPEPAALKALQRLTERERRAYTTHEVKDELALLLNQKPTQTLYLRAYQQLKKLFDQDRITKGGEYNKSWSLPEVTKDDMIESQLEELIK